MWTYARIQFTSYILSMEKLIHKYKFEFFWLSAEKCQSNLNLTCVWLSLTHAMTNWVQIHSPQSMLEIFININIYFFICYTMSFFYIISFSLLGLTHTHAHSFLIFYIYIFWLATSNMAWSLERTCSSYLKTWLLIISYTLLYLHSLDSLYIHLKHQSHLQILHLIYCLQSGTWSPLSLTLHVGKWVYYCCSFSACVCIFQSFGRKLLAWFLPLCM